MPILRSAVFAGLLGFSATAQVAKVLQLNDLATALEARSGHQAGAASPLERLARLLRAHWQNEAVGQEKGARRGRRTVIQVDEKSNSLLVSAQQEPAGFVEEIVGMLRKDPTRELRVHCTLLQLPLQVAFAHQLTAGLVTPLDEAGAGKLMKAAVQTKGSVRNLPELRVQPLLPFRAEPLPEPGKPATEASLRIRGEAVLVSEQEALFGVQLVAGALPVDPTALPSSPCFDRTFRLKAGTGIVILAPVAKDAPADAPAVALWLRFVEVIAPAPMPKPAAGATGH